MRKCPGKRVRKYTEARPGKIRAPVRQDRIEVSGYPTEAVCRVGDLRPDSIAVAGDLAFHQQFPEARKS